MRGRSEKANITFNIYRGASNWRELARASTRGAVLPLSQMERGGVMNDTDRLKELSEQIDKELAVATRVMQKSLLALINELSEDGNRQLREKWRCTLKLCLEILGKDGGHKQ